MAEEVPEEIPKELMRNGREEDQEFEEYELLYRRLQEQHVDGVKVSFEALELPDMSVNRSKFCGTAAWTLIPIKRDDSRDGMEKWGVFQFRVSEIPQELEHYPDHYSFAPRHVSQKHNYSHTEVRAFNDGHHINLKSDLLLHPEAHQRWRQQLAWKCRVLIEPQIV